MSKRVRETVPGGWVGDTGGNNVQIRPSLVGTSFLLVLGPLGYWTHLPDPCLYCCGPCLLTPSWARARAARLHSSRKGVEK